MNMKPEMSKNEVEMRSRFDFSKARHAAGSPIAMNRTWSRSWTVIQIWKILLTLDHGDSQLTEVFRKKSADFSSCVRWL
jgi:hypothetical protein